ncbi:hypothetical protein MW887_006446 [Aspergillus wentii]|nr:hypothetical protein MW887_006446 [Aspergillus wentii]
MGLGVVRKALPSSASQSGNLPVVGNSLVSPPKIDGPSDYEIPPLPTSAFSHMSLEDQAPTPQQASDAGFSQRNDSHRVSVPYVHTPANSGSWSVGDSQVKDESGLGKKRDSSSERDAQSGSHNSSSRGSLDSTTHGSDGYEPLQYHHQPYRNSEGFLSVSAATPANNSSGYSPYLSPRRPGHSPYSSGSDLGRQGRNFSPQASPRLHARSASRHSTSSPDTRPLSFAELLSAPYPQPGPAPVQLGNAHLRSSVGTNASLLSHKQTFDMYLANVKKTDDPAVQYEFAIFMLNAMLEMPADELDKGKSTSSENQSEITRAGLLREARSIFQRLADRSYPFAQYYLGDGYASGLFSKGKEDYDRAFPLFVAASKHGHIEACYRAALCYEFGWGNRVDAARAVQFYRQAASKNHPGAMMRMAKACLSGDMGLGKRYREGLKWMKRATESSDMQYNSAPYELGLLHEAGYGDDVFPDPSYAAQLFTKSADLGHDEACYRLGDAYEHGKLNCPRDPALSIHFYTGAAQRGHPLAMMALCAWYLVGAEPILDKDESEAYEWAKRAAELELAKAQYAVGYFTEMGIGCRRDPLEANVWYVKAADQGDARAMHRIAAIQAAADGANPVMAAAGAVSEGKKQNRKSGW